MARIIKNALIFLFIVVFYSASGQESFYISESGSFVRSEDQAVLKLSVEKVDNGILELYYAERNNKMWKGHNFLQKAIPHSDSVIQISSSRKMSDPFIRILISTDGDSKLIKQINKEGKLEFISEVLNIFPLQKHGKTTLYDLQGLPMLEEYYLLGKKISQTLLFNPVDSSSVITKYPEFPAGRKEFLKKIALQIKYPIHDMKNGKGGNTFVKFKIDETGKMCDIQPAMQPVNSLNKELLRTIEGIREVWQPAESDGQKIPVWYYATVSFQSPGF